MSEKSLISTKVERPSYKNTLIAVLLLALLSLLLPSPFSYFSQDVEGSSVELIKETAHLSGILLYREKIALTPGHVPVVILEDVSIADAPAKELGRVVLPKTSGNQPPYAWTLEYDASRIKESHTYSLRGQIFSEDSKLEWSTVTQYWVITKGHQTDSGHTLVLSKVDEDFQMPQAA